MQWRNRVALLLGAVSPIGLVTEANAAPDNFRPDTSLLQPTVMRDSLVYRDPADRARLLLYAGHSSHSSHASHASHSSHSSGSGGGYYTPAPSYYSPPASSGTSSSSSALPLLSPPTAARVVTPPPGPAGVKPSGPTAASKSTSVAGFSSAASAEDAPAASTPPKRLTDKELSDTITKVQLALVLRGYDVGPVNGKFEDATKAALKKFQGDNKLSASGLMDLQSLRLLGVVN